MRMKANKPPKEDVLKDVLLFLDPRGQFKATAILILANMLVFLCLVAMGLNPVYPVADDLLRVGANRSVEVLSGDYWRLLTSIFIHGGLLHLIVNVFGLGLAGSLLETKLGAIKMILAYLLCGVLASLSSIYFNDITISVGASGAIFGLFGIILAFTMFRVYESQMRVFTWMILLLYAGVNLVLGTLFSGVDNAAHFGGALSGFILGWLLSQKRV